MSSPMHDIPDHMLVPVTVDGHGPAFGDDFDHWACWCGDDDCSGELTDA